jgi:hypothetical protein
MVGDKRACKRCRGYGNHHGDLPCTRCGGSGSEAAAEGRAEARGEARLAARDLTPATRRALERIARRLHRAAGKGFEATVHAAYLSLFDVERLLGKAGS